MNLVEYKQYQETAIHGEVSFPYNTYLCSIPLDFMQVPLHWHDEIEIIYIKKGQGRVAVNLIDYQVAQGSILLVLPGQLHSIEMLEGCSMEYENIMLHPQLLTGGQMDACSRDFLLPLFAGRVHVPTHFFAGCRAYEELAGILDQCDSISEARPHGFQLCIKALLLRLFFILVNGWQEKAVNQPRQKMVERLKPVLKYVEQHYGEDISIEQAAQAAACSESHFMRSFKQAFDCSFIEFLKNYRLTIGASLLTGSDNTILSVANSVGFDNLSYFNRSFKAKYGMTPGQYRKQNS